MTMLGRVPPAMGRRLGPLPVALGVLAWSVVVVVARTGTGLATLPVRFVDVLLVAAPVGLAVMAMRTSRAALPATARLHHTAALGAWWASALAAALFTAPKLIDDPSLAWIVPAVIAAAWAMGRWPGAGLVLALAVTASFGSLGAYVSFFPYTRFVDVILVGLWLSVLARPLFGRGRQPTFLWPGLLALGLYLAVTVVGIVLSPDASRSLTFSRTTHWFMMATLLVAFGQWSRDTHARVARAVAAIALAVGVYALIAQIRGPTHAEYAQEATSIYNFVNGKPKLAGSFPNGADLGSWSALILPFCLSGAFGFRGRVRVACMLAIPLLAVGLLGSGVRAAGLAVLLGFLVVVLLHQLTRSFPGVRLGRGALAVVALVTLLGTIYAVGGSTGSPTGHSYAGLLGFGGPDSSLAEHRYKWATALRDLGGHPFGYGVGLSPTGYTANLSPGGPDSPADLLGIDNGYLEIAVQQGLAVMALFALALVLLLGGLARRAVACRDPGSATVAIGAAGTVATLGLLEGAGAYIDGLPALAAWVVIGLGVAQFMPSAEPAATGLAARRPPQRSSAYA